MVPLGPAESFDAFRALADRRGRPGDRLIEALGEARVGTADSPEVWAPAVGAGIGLPAAAALGPAGYYADLAAPHGRRHVRVCTATACFAAQTGRHLTDVEHELGITAGTASPDGKTSLQVVRCLGYCYAGPAALDGDTPCTGPTLAGQFAGREPSRAPEVPAADDTGDPVLLGGVVAGEPAWRTWPRAVTAGTPDEVQREVAASALRGRGGAGFRVAAKWESAGRAPGTVVGRAADTVVAPGAGGPWAESDCVACGGCVDTCPTGAITEPGPGRGLTSGVRPAASRTRTTCGYCGVGCALDVATRDGRVTAVLPVRDGPVNKGHACVKGRFAHGYLTSPERLTRPLLRRDGHLEPVGRDEALGHVARGLRAT